MKIVACAGVLCSIVFSFIVVACATPTPTVSTATWNAYTDPNGVGFYLYWKDKSNATAAYNNTNRFQVTGVTLTTEALSTILPAVHPSTICLVMTAFDGAGNESAFSNESCGFVGFSSVTGEVLK